MEYAAVCQLHSHSLQLVPLTLSQDVAHIGFVHDAAALLLYTICTHPVHDAQFLTVCVHKPELLVSYVPLAPQDKIY